MRRLLRVPSPGTVLGALALTVALGGTALADLPGTDTVVANDIANNAVRAPQIRAGAVHASEISASSVNSSEITDGEVQAGDMGALTVRQNTVSVAPGTQNLVIASCNAGEIAISGGGNIQGVGNDDVALIGTFRQAPNNWEAIAVNNDNVAHDLIAHAICLEA